jgi:hypothetical protein
MTAVKETTAKRIASIFRLLSSNHDGEVMSAVAAMKRLFSSEGLSFNDIATVIESCNGEIEEKKYSDSDVEIIFERGKKMGRAEEARNRPQIDSTEYYDADGNPQWNAIALYCQRHIKKLETKHHEFIDDMAGNTLYRDPTQRQGKYLLSLFFQLGRGRR